MLSICRQFCLSPSHLTCQLNDYSWPASWSTPLIPYLLHSDADPQVHWHAHCCWQKSFKKIQETVKSLYGDNALKRSQIYDIIKKGGGGETEDRPEGFQHEEAS
jgi:hypothetical protein